MARGLCALCYARGYRQDGPGFDAGKKFSGRLPARVNTCHPEAKHAARGLCASCYREWRVVHGRVKKQTREAKRKDRFMRNYGITVEQHAEAWRRNSGRCANLFCSFVATEMYGPRGLQVDHDHKTGKVRGLLCPQCNRALGFVKDDVRMIEGLVRYLSDPPTKTGGSCR